MTLGEAAENDRVSIDHQTDACYSTSMFGSVPDHNLPGSIARQAEAQSVIRWVAWLHIGLVFALFAFFQILSFWVNALKDLTVEGAVNEAVFFAIALASPVWMLVAPPRPASIAMIAVDVLMAALTGACGLFLLQFEHGGGVNDGPAWSSVFAAFTIAWLGMTALAWRAFRAASYLRRLASADGATLIARVFD